ncbi:MAG: hypothetical protein E7774_05665 [Bradyrhizobium sp.]|nr:MAG: hypothetical protein E7774_05665 [Bradyrhizobium sp.]
MREPHPLSLLAVGFALATALFLGGQCPALAATAPEPLIPIVGPPMRFVHVVSAAPQCQPNCPEWISAEGPIAVGTAQTFEHFLATLGRRNLPVLISSQGGSVGDAMAIGRTIRARKMAVIVARTELQPCASGQAHCDATPGVAALPKSICLSACPVVLAGGIERYVSGFAAIGVHQIRVGPRTMVRRMYEVHYRIVDGEKQEISRELTSEHTFTVAPTAVDLNALDTLIAKYFAEMGINDSIFKAMLATPPSGIDLLTNAELANSHLATQWLLDAPFSSSSADGKGGLNATPAPH